LRFNTYHHDLLAVTLIAPVLKFLVALIFENRD